MDSRRAFVVTAFLLLQGCAFSHTSIDTPAPPATGTDPPWRVARLSLIQGTVLFRAAGEDDWTAAELNRPVTTGDGLLTEAGARAELHTGNAALRIGERTSLTALELGSHRMQWRLTSGVLAAHVREMEEEEEEIEIATPEAAVVLLRPGRYRVEAASAGPGLAVIARSGAAELTPPDGPAFVLRQQQQARLPGANSDDRYTITAAPAEDAFDAFCAERDRREDEALATKHVPPRLIGSVDLHRYGDWSVQAAYGPVWRPRAAPPGWAPYRFGHWVWIEPWGWTWIDEAPWGFAPFHYGRWAMIEGYWVWVPGPYHRYPVYAPALVVFIGGGGPGLRVHFRIGVHLGVAWFPLGPREVWFPPYRASRGYLTTVNVTHTQIDRPHELHRTDIARQRYANRGTEGAVTAVPPDVFRGARPVQGAAVHVTAREAAGATVGGSAPPLAPARGSLAGGERRTPAIPPTARDRQPAVVKRAPPAPTAPFEQRRPAIDEAAGRAPDPRRQPPASRPPDYRQAPPAARMPERSAPAAPATRTPDTDRRRDQQWERRTARDESQRQSRIESERRTEPPAQGADRGAARRKEE